MSLTKSSNIAAQGQARTDFYRIAVNAGGTDYDVLEKLTAAVATTPTTSDVALTIREVESTKPTPNDDGTVNIEWEQYECGEDLWAFLDLVSVPPGGKKKREWYREDGQVRNASATDELILAIKYLFVDDDTTPTKVFVWATVGGLTANSGAVETKGAEEDDIIKPTLGFVGAKTEVDFTIPAALFRDTVVTAGSVADFTIPRGLGFKRKFCAIPE